MKVTLQQPHTHAGQQKHPGDKIDVDAEIAQWLAAQGVIAPLAAEASPTPAKSTQEK